MSLEIKSFDSPDETRPFADKGSAAAVSLASGTALKGTFEPGWRWSEHVKPIAGTDTCQAAHLGYVLSGRMTSSWTTAPRASSAPATSSRSRPGTTPGRSATRRASSSTSARSGTTRSGAEG